MAGDKFQNNIDVSTPMFSRGMQKDLDTRFLQAGSYISAINAVLNSREGDVFNIGNEPSTIKCSHIPYTFIGSIDLGTGESLIFSTNNTDSEIGVLDVNGCEYRKLVNDKCLNFNTNNLIIGVAKENYDCTVTAYWNDHGRNPARCLNTSNIPYIQTSKPDPEGGCDILTDTKDLDCEKLRLSPLMSIPSLDLSKSDGGSLPNGSYRVVFAYSVNEIRVSDYLIVSQPQYLFNQTGVGGGLEISISGADNDFKEFQLVLISTVDQQTTARLIGYYPISQSNIYIDQLKQSDIRIELSDIPLQNIYYEGGDEMYEVNSYLIQTGARTRKEFNYQPLANKIRAKWVAYAVPENYYRTGGSKIGYTKGETIALYIRFVYNTGHKTSAFPLVGREALNDEKSVVNNADSLAYGEGERVEKWEIYDTSVVTARFHSNASEYKVMEGDFGYYESTEEFPDNREVWGSLSCQKRRLFRFPDNSIVPNYDPVTKKIIILGLRVENVAYPLDENGDPVEGVVGYEILRADREGNRDVMSKGLIFNTGIYESQTAFNEKSKTLYSNYPFNDLRVDPFLSAKMVNGGCNGSGYQALGTFSRNIFTYHSPETSFAFPTLGSIMKVEAEYYGKANGNFEPVYRHPKAKVIRDFAFFIAALVGIGEGILAITGKRTYNVDPTIVEGQVTILGVGAKAYKPLPLISSIIVTGPLADVFGLKGKGSTSRTSESTAFDGIPLPLRIANSVVLFTYYFGQGTNAALEIIESLIPYQQYAYQYNAEGLFDHQKGYKKENTIRRIDNYSYLYPNNQEFEGYKVNNNLRESSVILKLNSNLSDPSTVDNSRQTIGNKSLWSNPTKPFLTDISAFYVSIRRKLKAQYGQVDSVNLLPVGSAVIPINTDSDILFGGDTIIDEFTVKRKMSYFNQTAYDVPDGYEFDYRLYPNILYPRYWIDTHPYDITEFFNLTSIKLPNDSHYLDRKPGDCNKKVSFMVKNAYFYLYNSGVTRFFVESTYNLPFRQNSTTNNEKKFYDKGFMTDLSILFRSDVIGADNYFEIDKSLSPIKQLPLTYAEVQPRDFSIANARCFSYDPNKIIYSLPSNLESKRDTWRDFLVNNYYIFAKSNGKITSIKEVGRTGALYFFQYASPLLHPGVDELQTEGGQKITIGDGGLFAREPQSITNSDYEFGECQSGFSVISTRYGIFYISQFQGKILQYGGELEDISTGIKWWLSQYLPSRLLSQFPDFELADNPVTGVGCLAGFDNVDEIVYFSKKDYEVKPEYLDSVTYLDGDRFQLNGRRTFTLGDPRYFNDASWTLSYDPKMKAWVSFHDWHPDWFINRESRFLTIKDSYIWKHNEATDSFCNFYGVDYPWEIELPAFYNPADVRTLESIEYQLECFKYFDNDRYHILDENFDRAIIYNSEQCSGLLKLVRREYNRPYLILNYPKYNPGSVEVEVTKQEQKYRFNQFTDLTKNRGQFTLNWRPIFKTEANGYKKSINPNNVDYNKAAGQRKKFRHTNTNLILRKNVSSNVKMLLRLAADKTVKSFR